MRLLHAGRQVSLWMIVGLCSCLPATTFVRTDSSFSPRKEIGTEPVAGPLPEVFLDRLPARPYRSVGIIQVNLAITSGNLGDVVKAAQQGGAQTGCQVVVDRAIHAVTWRTEPDPPVARGVYLAGLSPYVPPRPLPPSPRPPPQAPQPSPGFREFICGLFTDTPDGDAAPGASDSKAPSSPLANCPQLPGESVRERVIRCRNAHP